MVEIKSQFETIPVGGENKASSAGAELGNYFVSNGFLGICQLNVFNLAPKSSQGERIVQVLYYTECVSYP